jgi:hypothetical protein
MFILGSTLTLSMSGCGSNGASLCAAKCDCEGCSESEYDHCLDEDDNEFYKADARGCLYEYDSLIACEDATGYCKDGHDWETSCGRERDDYRHCVD